MFWVTIIYALTYALASIEPIITNPPFLKFINSHRQFPIHNYDALEYDLYYYAQNHNISVNMIQDPFFQQFERYKEYTFLLQGEYKISMLKSIKNHFKKKDNIYKALMDKSLFKIACIDYNKKYLCYKNY